MSDVSRDLLDIVAEAEAAIRPALECELREAVESDSPVDADVQDWNRTAGATGGADVLHRATAREANHLTNLVRYRALTGGDPPGSLRSTPVAPFRDLERPSDVEAVLDDLLGALRGRSDLDADVLGARYEDALPEEERRARGQFYTPPAVADALVRWALAGTDGLPRVLDPAAGTGTFPLAAHDRLRERRPDAAPSDLHDRLLAVDVDDAALHLAALRLSARGDGTEVAGFDRRARSFFDLEPEGDGGLGRFDAVVGNPPFVRAGDLRPDRDHFREHLRAFGPGDVPADAAGEAPYADGERGLSGRCDASVYFVTHATRFLRPGGRLGVVLPAKWLESDYGIGFRRFLADHYRVRAVVGFGARAFDALVDTVLLVAERRERRPEPREDDTVRFLRLDGGEDVAGALDRIEPDGQHALGAGPVGTSRVVERSQSTFAEARQCSPYLRAPRELLSLLEHPALVPLGELASVRRGVTTGANRFFLLDREDRERWSIGPDVRRPAIRSIRGLDSRTLSPEAVDLSILDVHGVLDCDGRRGGVRRETGDDATARAKAALARAGHDGVVEYVERAEAEGVHERRTCQARHVWFDLGPLPTPDAFVPKLLRERVFTVRNRAGAVPSNAIDCLSVEEGVDPTVLLGVLDSSLTRAVMEVWGRDEAGMLQLMTFETRTLPVPDVRRFSESEAARVRRAAAAIDDDGGHGENQEVGGAQARLDEAVVGALGLDLDAPRVRTLRERLLRRRVDGGERVEVPLS